MRGHYECISSNGSRSVHSHGGIKFLLVIQNANIRYYTCSIEFEHSKIQPVDFTAFHRRFHARYQHPTELIDLIRGLGVSSYPVHEIYPNA
jgi:hypothetical protein